MRRLFARTAGLAVVAASLLLGAPSGPVSAHASISSTSPGDGVIFEERPEDIEIVFNEKVETSPGSARLIDSEAEIVELVETSSSDEGGATKVRWAAPSDLETGWYAVAWRAISADGHPISGTFTFYYGDPDLAGDAARAADIADPTAPYVTAAHVIRTVTYLAVILAVGLLLAIWAVSGPLAVAGVPHFAVGLRRAATVAAVAGLVLTPLSLLVSAVILNGGSTQSIGVIIQIVLQSSTGAALLVRMSALFGLCTAVLLLAEKGTRKAGVLVGVLAAVALTVSYPMGGHPSVVPWKMVASTAEVLHLLAAAAWLGGIPAVAWLVWRRRQLDDATVLEVVARFSRIATVSVVAVLVGGVTLTAAMLTSPSELVTTRYGVTVTVKFALVSLVALAGAYNHFVLLPGLRKRVEHAGVGTATDADNGGEQEGATGGGDHGGDVRTHLRTSLLSEAAMLLVVLAATGALTSVAAPAAGDNHFVGGGHSHGGGSLGAELDLALADLEPRIVLAPIGPGEARVDYLPGRSNAQNRFVIRVSDAQGVDRRLTGIEASIRNESLDIGPIERRFEIQQDGSWLLVSRDFGVPGQWSMELIVSFEDGEIDTTTMTIDIRPPAGQEFEL